MDDTDTELACILTCCGSDDELRRHIMRHATIVQHLVCRMGKEVHQSEAGFRTLYSNLADMAVERFKDPREFPIWKPP